MFHPNCVMVFSVSSEVPGWFRYPELEPGWLRWMKTTTLFYVGKNFETGPSGFVWTCFSPILFILQFSLSSFDQLTLFFLRC